MRTNINLKEVDPPNVGAPLRSKVAKDLNGNIYIVKSKKSRITMKEGRRILEVAKKIKREKNLDIYLATTAPICSKTKAFLEENQIKAVFDYTVK